MAELSGSLDSVSNVAEVGSPTDIPGGDPRLRVLAIGDVYPWPARDGYRLRFASVLSGLAGIAEIDVFVCAYPGEEHVEQPPEFVNRFRVVRVPFTDRTIKYVARLLTSRLPHRILQRDWKHAEPELRAFARPPYDVVWFSHADSYAAFGHLMPGAAIVDLDNLEDLVIQRSKRSRNLRGCGSADSASTRGRLSRLRDRREQWCWTGLQREILKTAAVVTVCSPLDRDRLNGHNVAVVPNGYRDPGPIEWNVLRDPVLLMVARFTYEPNLAGAYWFVHEVFGRLRESVPEAHLRLVGKYDKRLLPLGNVPNVQIVGEVADVGPEVKAARVVVVPLMCGGGTRLKILEAFAYGRPVITTTVGVEGFEIEPGNEALVADNPERFASLCKELLMDEERGRRIGEVGRSFFLNGYQSHHVQGSVIELVRAMAGPEGQ